MRERQPCVYIMASGYLGTLYTGATSDLAARVIQHRAGVFDGFTKRHHVTSLVWFDFAELMESVITAERRIKRWRRDWKIALIEERNRYWEDLGPTIGLPPLPR